MAATDTLDVLITLDGCSSYGPEGDWGGYWGKQGPELLDRRLSLCDNDQGIVFGANTVREFVEMVGLSADTSGVDA